MRAAGGAATRPFTRVRPGTTLAYARANWRTLIWWLPVACAALYALVVLARFSSIITVINMNGDAVIAPVLSKLAAGAPDGAVINLGNHAWYEEYLFLRATSGLPFYHQLVDVVPALWTLGGLALLVWMARHVFGWWGAALAGAALLCVGTLGRFMAFTFQWHGLGLFHTIVLAAALVWLVRAGLRTRWPLLLAAGVGLGLFTALPTASDPIFPVWGLLPFALTAGAVALADRRLRVRAVAFGASTLVVALAGGALLTHTMKSNGFVAEPLNTAFATADKLIPNLQLMLDGFTGLAGGHFFGEDIDRHGLLVFISGVLFLAALGFALHALPAIARRLRAAVPDERFVYLTFWGIALVVTCAVFLLTSVPVDIMSARFLLPGYVAVGALLPLFALRSTVWRATVTAGVCVFALLASYQVLREPSPGNTSFPGPAEVNGVEKVAKQYDVHYGYAHFWVAPDVTWLTYFRLKVFPVESCDGTKAGICPPRLMNISSWYTARPNERSMVIVDPQRPLAAPGAELGKPLAVRQVGRLTVYVYPFDIPSRF